MADLSRQRRTVLDKPIGRGKGEVSLSAFSFLFSELVQYSQSRVQNIAELERRLEDAGHNIGSRLLELYCYRDKQSRRETRLLHILQFVYNTCWKSLFGKTADALEKSAESEDSYMIHEREPITNRFISVPPDMGGLNCAAFLAGIIRGVVSSAGFPAEVTAHFVSMGAGQPEKTVFLVKFAPEVIEREARLEAR